MSTRGQAIRGNDSIIRASHIAPGVRCDNVIQLGFDLMKALSYDGATGNFIWVKHYKLTKRGSIAGKTVKQGYRKIRYQNRYFSAHRLAWLFTYGVWPEGEIDHIDGDKANNRICNLRIVNRAQNQFNTPCRGYYLNKRGKYHSSIRAYGRRHYLGEFRTEEEARYAYEAAASNITVSFPFYAVRLLGWRRGNERNQFSLQANPLPPSSSVAWS